MPFTKNTNIIIFIINFLNTIINIRTGKKIKQQAESLYKRLGLNLTSAINAFLSASLRENGIHLVWLMT